MIEGFNCKGRSDVTMIGVSPIVSADAIQHRPPEARLSLPGDRSVSLLERLIRLEIVPRLTLARHKPEFGFEPLAHLGAAPDRERIEELTKIVLASGEDRSFDYVEEIRRQGTSIERLYLGLMTSVARHLGDLWTADFCSFTDVTFGLWRLQQLARTLSPIFQQDASARLQRYHALLVPLPGEQHTFGLYLVAEFFRRAGWGVCSMPLKATEDVVAIVRNEWFSLIGLSLSCESRLEQLASEIRIIRRASCNHGLCVMVGGAVFIEHPELVSQVGADLMAIDGRQAPATAQDFVESVAAYQ
jgi:MerR family transcriptional regulator, light-induced transcriptional regulator